MAFARYIKFVSQLDSVEQLPRQLIHTLKESVVEVGDDVMQEDEGWGITFRHNGGAYRFYSRFDGGSEPLECMGWVEHQDDHGFLASLFGPKETYRYPEIEPLVQSAFSRLPNVRDVAWCSGDEK